MDAPTAVKIVDLTRLYWTVGIMVVANVGSIGSVVFIMGKGLWWVSKLDSRVETNSKEIKYVHRRVTTLENKT